MIKKRTEPDELKILREAPDVKDLDPKSAFQMLRNTLKAQVAER